MSAIEQEIIKRLHKLDSDNQKKVLEFIEKLPQPSSKHYSARELMKLPVEERDRIVAEAFERASKMDFETFEAYSEESLDDDS